MIAEHMRWSIDETRCCLVPADDLLSEQTFDAHVLKRMLGDNYSKYKYYMFNYNNEPRFVFVTNLWINFYQFAQKCGEKKSGFIAHGALYDLKEKKFICFPKRASQAINGVFYKFYLYDIGVPNIIYNSKKDNYTIFCVGKRAEFKMVSSISCVTSSTCDNKGKISLNRAIFYEKAHNGFEESKTIILYDSLKVKAHENKMTFNCCVMGRNFSNSEIELQEVAKKQIEENSSHTKEEEHGTTKGRAPCYLLMGDSCIITNSPLGGYGDLVPICLSKKLLLNYGFGCFAFEIVENITNPQFAGHLILKCSWAKNDFENEVSYFDVTDRFVYDALK